MQRIHDDVEFEIEYFKTENTEKGVEIQNSKFKIQNSFIRPFDLSRAPLLRVGLIKIRRKKTYPDGGYASYHYGWHLYRNIYKRVYGVLCAAGEELLPLRIQYKDFSEWQKQRAQRKSMTRQEAYWLKEFEGEIPLA